MLLPFYMFPKVSEKHCDSRAAFSCSISSEENRIDFHCRSRSWASRARFNFFTCTRDLLYIACILVYDINARKIYVRTHSKNYTTVVIIFRGTAT